MGQFERVLADYQRDAAFRAALVAAFDTGTNADALVLAGIASGVLPADISTWRQTHKAAAHWVWTGDRDDIVQALYWAETMTEYCAAHLAVRKTNSSEAWERFKAVYEKTAPRVASRRLRVVVGPAEFLWFG